MKRDARVYIEDILESMTKMEEYMRGLKLDFAQRLIAATILTLGGLKWRI